MANTASTARQSSSQIIGPWLVNIAVLALVSSYAMPFVYLLLTSIKPPGDVLQIPPSFLPTRLNFLAISFCNACSDPAGRLAMKSYLSFGNAAGKL